MRRHIFQITAHNLFAFRRFVFRFFLLLILILNEWKRNISLDLGEFSGSLSLLETHKYTHAGMLPFVFSTTILNIMNYDKYGWKCHFAASKKRKSESATQTTHTQTQNRKLFAKVISRTECHRFHRNINFWINAQRLALFEIVRYWKQFHLMTNKLNRIVERTCAFKCFRSMWKMR